MGTAINTAIKAVVFDLGKVLVDFDYSIAVRKIAARGRMNVRELTRLMTADPLLLDYELGKLTNEQFYAQICKMTGFGGDMQEFAALFGDIFSPIEPMIGLQQDLINCGFPTFVFSNTNDLAIRHIRKTFPFFSNFKGYVLSYEHGSMKPAPELYEVLERQSGFRGSEIFYLDDRPENVEAGAARGWCGVVHETPEETILKVRGLGLLGPAWAQGSARARH